MSLTSITLSACQFFYMAVIAINLAFNSLVAQQLASNRSLSTLPYLFVMGTTAGLVLFLPRLFDRWGYRKLFVLGAIAGAMGGLLASLALVQRSFWLFCCAGLLIGVFQATAMYYRYAAADSVATEHKGTAIAWVLNGGIVSALLSKYIADASLKLFSLEYLGSFVMISALSLSAVPILLWVPLSERSQRTAPTEVRWGRIDGSAIAAVLFCSMGYLVMAMVMLASPLAMSGCGFRAPDAASVIQWHLLGMFAPSLLTGKLISAFGARPIAYVGIGVLGLGCGLAMHDQSLTGFHLALAVVGVGWNLMYLGGSTLLTVIPDPARRGRVQAMSEFVTFAVTTLIAGATGWLYAIASWNGVLTVGFVCLALVAAATAFSRKRPSAA